MVDKTIYQEHGYRDRNHYLNCLAEEYGEDAVFSLADLLGESEDFDGLISSLEGYEE